MTDSRPAEEAEIVRIKAEHQIAKMDHEREMALFDEKSIGRMPLALRLMFDDRLRDRVHRAAEEMAKAVGFTPPHLIGKTEACLVVVTRAVTWNLDPYSVAMTTYQTPGGKVGYEGALVRAILEASGELRGLIRQEWYGDWSKLPRPSFKMARNEDGKLVARPAWEYWSNIELGLGVRISATLASTGEEMSLDFDLMDAHPRNATTWPTRPKLQLLNPAIRAFAKQVRPSLLMGVHFADDQSDAADMRDVTPASEPTAPAGARKTSVLAPQIGPQSRQDAAGTQKPTDLVSSSPKVAEPPTEDAGESAKRVVSGDRGVGAEDERAIETARELAMRGPEVPFPTETAQRLRAQAVADASGHDTPAKRRGRPPGSKNKPRDDVREQDEKAAGDLKDRAMAPDVDEMALDLIYQDEAFKRLEIRAKDLAEEVVACVEQSRRELPDWEGLGNPDELKQGARPIFNEDFEASGPVEVREFEDDYGKAEPAEASEAEETQPAASGKLYKMLNQSGKAFDELPAADWLDAFEGYIGGNAPAERRRIMLKNNRGILEDIARQHPEMEPQWTHMLAEARR